MKNWKKRWFSLRGDHLYYYETPVCLHLLDISLLYINFMLIILIFRFCLSLVIFVVLDLKEGKRHYSAQGLQGHKR